MIIIILNESSAIVSARTSHHLWKCESACIRTDVIPVIGIKNFWLTILKDAVFKQLANSKQQVLSFMD